MNDFEDVAKRFYREARARLAEKVDADLLDEFESVIGDTTLGQYEIWDARRLAALQLMVCAYQYDMNGLQK